MTNRSTSGTAATQSHERPEDWHLLSADETTERLQSVLGEGLASEEAARRLVVHGPNEIQEQARRSALQMLLGQFTDFMILLLMAAALIAGAVGEAADAVAILAIVVLNAVIGFVQEYRAEKALQALKQLAALRAKVWRDRQIVTIPATELVPGDLVVLEAGSVVPADLRLTEAVQLRVE
jgi:Ca2+-transporting ATPase